ncbi:MAG: hypothetical protein ACRD2C_24160 [Acidimicrobiales bacterium]
MKKGRRYRSAWLVAVLGLITASCSSGDDGRLPEAQGRWERTGTWPHQDVTSFDHVAVGATAGTVAWLTRRARGETGALAYLEMRHGDDPVEIEVPTPTDRVVIPVAVATSEAGWAAVAVTRDLAHGENTGLMAWNASIGADPAIAPAEVLPRLGEIAPPESVSIGRSTRTTVVTAVLDGVALTWDTTNDQPGWEAAQPDLDLTEDLVSLRVVGDGDRLVLAGVDVAGAAHLWTSTNGDSWDRIASDRLPDDAGAVGLLASLGHDQVAVGWLDDEDSAPFSATATTVQLLEDDGLTDQGRITADGSDQERIDVSGATTSPDGRLVVVGAALRANGAPFPMVWVRDDDRWQASGQPDLVGRLDHVLRAVTTTRDDTMVGLVTAVAHIDVETWRWRPAD